MAVRIMWFRACELTLNVLVYWAGADGGVGGGVAVISGAVGCEGGGAQPTRQSIMPSFCVPFCFKYSIFFASVKSSFLFNLGHSNHCESLKV